MPKKKISVTCVYGKQDSARKIIEQSFLSFLQRVYVCNKK